MPSSKFAALGLALAWVAALGSARAQTNVTLLAPAKAGSWCEFRVDGLPPVANPFDPDVIRVDATVTGPGAGAVSVPAFWFQDYVRSLVGGSERLAPFGKPQWRVRCFVATPGLYSIEVRAATNGRALGAGAGASFTAAAPVSPPALAGFARKASDGAGFVNGDGSPLGLVGANVCWPGARGTYDYDDWFPALAAARGNYARIWLCPWEFGVEAAPGTLTQYRLDRAWKLDRVLAVAESLGIRLMFCLDYHGMFATRTDPTFGGGDDWKVNPYSAALGGPCATPNQFFTNAAAIHIYQKRLRYLVARYGARPGLFSWEFLNEIDNVYYGLQPSDVASWHAVNGAWLHANDPYRHLVTTSLTGGSERPEIWRLQDLDYTQYHSYGEAFPAARLAEVGASFRSRYGKPVVIGEFGVDFRGWMRSADPYLRGFRQGLWGGALGGSAGTAMSWWWENLSSENVYPLHGALRTILARTRWQAAPAAPISFATSGPPPATVGAETPGGAPFTVTLFPGGQWAAKPSGTLAVPNPAAADDAASTLNAFVQGADHPDLRVPLKINAWFAAGARVVPHVNSVSFGARLGILVDGKLVVDLSLPDKDGQSNPTVNEYNVDVPADVPPGNHTVEIRNLGGDWFYLDFVRVEQAAPAAYAGDWRPSPAAIGLRGPDDALIYVVAPGLSYPAQATRPAPAPQTGLSLILSNWPAGSFVAQWFNPTNAAPLGETTAITSASGVLKLPLPVFAEDAAGVVFAVPLLKAPVRRAGGSLEFRAAGPLGYAFVVERAADLHSWTPVGNGTFSTPAATVEEPAADPAAFFRIRVPASP